MCLSKFMPMNAVNCTKPGYTRRRAPGKRDGTEAMRLCSNHSMGRALASSLTLVGLTRVSTGPAIKVMLRGVAALPASERMATAASACTQDWHTATTCTPGPIASRKPIRCSTYWSNPNRPCVMLTSRPLCQSVIDVVLGSRVSTVPRRRVAVTESGATNNTRGCATADIFGET